GDAAASRAALGGALLEGGEALRLGLVDELVAGDRLLEVARARAASLGHGQPAAFRSIKALLRARTAETMRAVDPASLEEFVAIWSSESTRRELRKIRIRE